MIKCIYTHTLLVSPLRLVRLSFYYYYLRRGGLLRMYRGKGPLLRVRRRRRLKIKRKKFFFLRCEARDSGTDSLTSLWVVYTRSGPAVK